MGAEVQGGVLYKGAVWVLYGAGCNAGGTRWGVKGTQWGSGSLLTITKHLFVFITKICIIPLTKFNYVLRICIVQYIV